MFVPFEGPCYRCLYPTPPPPELAPGCSVAGVLGVVPGVMGLLQATEAIKVILGLGDPLVGRLLIWDALDGTFTEVKLRRDPNCPAAVTRRESRSAGRPPRPSRPLAAGHGLTTRVRIPPVLRTQVAGQKEVDASGATVGEGPGAWSHVTRQMGEQLLSDDGGLHRFVNVYLNGQDVRYLQLLDTPVAERDALIILPAMAGVPDPGARYAGGAPSTGRARSATLRWSSSRCLPDRGSTCWSSSRGSNPTGSVKDRVARYLIERSPERDGRRLRPVYRPRRRTGTPGLPWP